MQYGILSAERNLFEELSHSNPEDFTEDFCDDAEDKNCIYMDDIENCGYDFLTRIVDPNVEFPVVKREIIKEEVDDVHLYTGHCV